MSSRSTSSLSLLASMMRCSDIALHAVEPGTRLMLVRGARRRASGCRRVAGPRLPATKRMARPIASGVRAIKIHRDLEGVEWDGIHPKSAFHCDLRPVGAGVQGQLEEGAPGAGRPAAGAYQGTDEGHSAQAAGGATAEDSGGATAQTTGSATAQDTGAASVDGLAGGRQRHGQRA